MIQEVRTLMDLDMKILEALDKLSRVQVCLVLPCFYSCVPMERQVDISERSYQIEGQVDNLRSDVRQSKSSASRLLNRAKGTVRAFVICRSLADTSPEHIRGEHENIQQERRATYKAHDKMAEDLRREVTHTMALLNRQDRIALCQIHQLEAELAALRASFWSARIYVFIVSVVTAVRPYVHSACSLLMRVLPVQQRRLCWHVLHDRLLCSARDCMQRWVPIPGRLVAQALRHYPHRLLQPGADVVGVPERHVYPADSRGACGGEWARFACTQSGAPVVGVCARIITINLFYVSCND